MKSDLCPFCRFVKPLTKILFLQTILLFPFSFFLSNAQVPQGFNYQAIARGADGKEITNTTLEVKISILSDTSGFYLSGSGTYIWEEQQTVKTNNLGLFTLAVGNPLAVKIQGNAVSFSSIDWKVSPLYIGTKINFNGWKNLGSARLWTVPYSMIAGDLDGAIKKLEVEGEDTASEEALFEVRRKDGQVMFAVYNHGVRVYMPLDTLSKARKGGFSIGGFSKAKGTIQDYIVVNPDSIRAYIDTNPSKAKKGGFAIGGFDKAKAGNEEYLRVTRDSTKIYLNDTGTKGFKGGFSIGGFSEAKGVTSRFFDVSVDEVGIVNPSQNRILWYPQKNAFLTGKVFIDSPLNVGENSFATGYESRAKGLYSQAMGYRAIANGDYSTAIGKNAVAELPNSFAFGDGAQALGNGSTAFGFNSKAQGTDSYAFGPNTVASGQGSFASGALSTASGKNSTAIGRNSVAAAENAFAIGYNCKANYANSGAIGYNTTANGQWSLALGEGSYAGNPTLTYGTAFAFGMGDTATAIYSTAIGYNTRTNGSYSVGLGYKLITQAKYSVVVGAYNAPYGTDVGYFTDPVFVVGNGYAMGSTIYRRNALSVLLNGNVGISNNNPAYLFDVAGSGAGNIMPSATSMSGTTAIIRTGDTTPDHRIALMLMRNSDDASSTDRRVSLVLGHTAWGTMPQHFYGRISGGNNSANGAGGYLAFHAGYDGIGAVDHFKLTSDGYGYLYGKLFLNNYSGAAAYVNTPNVEIGGSSPSSTNGLATMFFHHHGAIAHQLRYSSGVLYLEAAGNGYGTNPTPIFQVNGPLYAAVNGGNVGIGTASPTTKLFVEIATIGDYVATFRNGVNNYLSQGIKVSAGTSLVSKVYGARYIRFSTPNDIEIGSISQASTTSIAFNTTSDRRLKDNIVESSFSINDLMRIRVRDYNFINEYKSRIFTGFIAQELYEVIPQVVTMPLDSKGYWSIDYGKMTPFIVKAVQDQQEVIKSLQADNKALKEELADIKARLDYLLEKSVGR